MDGSISSVTDCKLITFDKIESDQGNLSVIEGGNHLPFTIERVYYIYDIPAGSERGSHAHKSLEQVLIAISGSFDVHIFDGKNTNTITLNRPNIGLHLKAGIWRTLDNFSSSAVCLTLASQKYQETDYIRDKEKFKEFKL